MAKKKKAPSGQSAGVVDESTQPTPIGVPKGYTATVSPQFAPDPLWAALGQTPPQTSYQRAPRYFDGDEWLPAGGEPDDITPLQLAMEAAGLYDEDYTTGQWTAVDAAAYKKLLTAANASGQDDKTTLQRLIAAPKTDINKTKRQPLTVRLSNPDDIKELVTKVAGSLYGGRLPDNTTQAIVSAVQSQEAAYQQSAYNMAETGGTVVDPASAETVATRTIREQHPNEVAATQFADMFDTILSTMNTSPSNYQGIKYP